MSRNDGRIFAKFVDFSSFSLEMGPILTIAWGITLGFIFLAIILWIIGLLLWWLLGPCVMPKVNGLIGNGVGSVSVSEVDVIRLGHAQ